MSEPRDYGVSYELGYRAGYAAAEAAASSLTVERLRIVAYQAWRESGYPVSPWPDEVFERILVALTPSSEEPA